MLTKKQFLIKRLFDLSVSLLLIPIILLPLLFLVVVSTLTTGKFGIFRQKRIGYHGKSFTILKIRSLRGVNHNDINDIMEYETPFGAWLRKSKLDELPQIFNVIFGSMSLVGPRPDIPGYADKLVGEDRMILNVKPGVTGPATMKYSAEDQLLKDQLEPKKYNDEVIWIDKVKINKEYINNWSFWKDVRYLFSSIV